MILDFDQIERKTLPEFKGGEGLFLSDMYSDRLGKIMRGHLAPGCSIGLHTHEGNSEIIYLIEGEGVVIYDGERERLLPGQAHYCPMGHSHSLRNESDRDLTFIGIVPEHHIDK